MTFFYKPGQCISSQNERTINTDYQTQHIYRDFISRGNILNNKVNLSYGPQTITSATNTQEIIKSEEE